MKIPIFTSDQKRSVIVIGSLALAFALFFFFSARTDAVTPISLIDGAGVSGTNGPNSQISNSAGNNPTIASSTLIYVDVAGKVKNPGVFQLPSGSRVIDAIQSAGGVKRGVSTTHINMARRLSDGEQVLVTNEKVKLPSSSSGRKAIYSGKVSINSASKAQLDSLPGIGPVIAERILVYRKSNGPFAQLEDIQKVNGIGAAIFAQISSRITL
jgi:competence protein ComEA